MTDSASDVPRHQECLIDRIMPCREIHLIGGSSGSSKTTLIFQTLLDWQNGRDVFGKSSFPVPYAYMACERSQDSTQRTFDRCKLELNCHILEGLSKPWNTAQNQHRLSIENLLYWVKNNHPETRFLFIDGFQNLTPNGKINDYHTVSNMLIHTTTLCQRLNLTVMGSTHATKLRENEKIINPRERIAGSVAWPGYSETVIIVDVEDPEDTHSKRLIHIMPRNAPQVKLEGEMTHDGLLLLHAPAKKVPKGQERQAVQSLLSTMEPGAEFGLAELADRANVSLRLVYNLRDPLTDDGTLEFISHGKYRKPISSIN